MKVFFGISSSVAGSLSVSAISMCRSKALPEMEVCCNGYYYSRVLIVKVVKSLIAFTDCIH